MDIFYKIIEMLFNAKSKKRKTVLPILFFASLDYLAGYYALIAINKSWLLDLETSKIILFGSLISFAALAPVMIFFIGGANESIEKDMYLALVADTVCWIWAAGLLCVLYLLNQVSLINMRELSVKYKIYILIFSYCVSFWIFKLMLKKKKTLLREKGMHIKKNNKHKNKLK